MMSDREFWKWFVVLGILAALMVAYGMWDEHRRGRR